MGTLFRMLALVLAFALAVAEVRAVRAQDYANSPATLLVQGALRAELSGDNFKRGKLLKHALAISPDSPQARWQAGYIRTGDEWITVGEHTFRAANDPLVAEYRSLRDQYAATLAGQIALARWCRKHNMPERERLHLHTVLTYQPSNDEARKRLGLSLYRGALLTQTEIEACKQADAKAAEALEYWTPRLRRWRDDFNGNDPELQQAALHKIRGIEDVAAIAAVEDVLSPNPLLASVVVEWLGQFDQREATFSLVRHALHCEESATRNAAIEHLVERPKFSYLPELLATLQNPVVWEFQMSWLPSRVNYNFACKQEGPTATYVMRQNSSTNFTSQRNALVFHVLAAQERLRKTADSWARRGTGDAQRIEQSNREKKELNERIYAVLERVTGEQLEHAPQAWWEWWEGFNELEPSYEKPVYYVEHFDTYEYHVPSPPMQSCFLRGTMVWTETGSVRIESIRPGDLVLAQNPQTGELLYKPVVQTTVRPPTKTLRLKLDQEVIGTTLGHPFWVVGEGWRMAKRLQGDELLHGFQGAVPITSIEPGPEDEAFNLVVADVHTYFVGEQRVLVHDNTRRAPLTPQLPGLQASP